MGRKEREEMKANAASEGILRLVATDQMNPEKQPTVDDRIGLLALSMIEHLGPVTIKALLTHFGSPAKVFEGVSKGGGFDLGLKPSIVQAISSGQTLGMAQIELEAAASLDIEMVSIFEDAYPTLLRNTYDAPVVLFKRGILDLNAAPTIAIVGTRDPSALGLSIAKEYAKYFAEEGFNVISGLALGIDGAAHEAAVQAHGITTAVLGHGLDLIYPSQHENLADRILNSGGALLSEFPIGTKPDSFNFPARNRLIAGMCHATLVVEAKDKGGALITAKMAFDQNRQVFAIPGSLNEPRSVGSNKLIRDCVAKLVLAPDEILEDLKSVLGQGYRRDRAPRPSGTTSGPMTFDEHLMYLIQEKGKSFDEILKGFNLDAKDLTKVLLSLEMKGMVSSSSGAFLAVA